MHPAGRALAYFGLRPAHDEKKIMNSNDFAGLGLPQNLVRTLAAAGFTTPTQIQQQSIPAQLAGQDILGLAQTGSGKTAAFGLPLVAQLTANPMPRHSKTVGALILAPTRELAVQIEEMIRTYSRNTGLSTCLVLGGLSRQGQINKLQRGIDIVIATPGRLADLMEAKKVRLDQTKYLVLDEADRMLDMGFVKQVKQIAAATAKDRRTALFSATMAPEVAQLAAGLLKDPVRVEAQKQGTTVAEIDQQAVSVPTKMKRNHLNSLLADESLSRVILFCRTKHGADKVTKNLAADGHSAAAIHGNKSQGQRQNALRAFRDGKNRILVATDIVARGIDVPEISHVINYDLPDEAESYVHRIGRTGRNGASGTAISMIDPSERSKLRAIEKLIGRRLNLGAMPEGYAEQAAAMPRSEPRAEPRPARSGSPKGKSTKRDGERHGAEGQRPRRQHGKPGQRPNRRNPASRDGAQSGWMAQLDSGADADSKPKKAKKPRWSTKQKNAAKAARAAQQYGEPAMAR